MRRDGQLYMRQNDSGGEGSKGKRKKNKKRYSAWARLWTWPRKLFKTWSWTIASRSAKVKLEAMIQASVLGNVRACRHVHLPAGTVSTSSCNHMRNLDSQDTYIREPQSVNVKCNSSLLHSVPQRFVSSALPLHTPTHMPISPLIVYPSLTSVRATSW